MGEEKVRVRVRRQDGPDERPRWETFSVPRLPAMTVHDVLVAISRHPVTIEGDRVAPVAWEAPCRQDDCGACTARVNGRPAQMCMARLDDVAPKGTLTLEPLAKLPVERDLIADGDPVADRIADLQAWIDDDGESAEDVGREAPEAERLRRDLLACTGCGACLDACPQFRSGDGGFVGAAAINRVRAVNLHPVGALAKRRRLEALMGPNGLARCGKAENCAVVCPKGIPLTESIAVMNRDATLAWLFGGRAR